ncbi:MAG: ferrochelatase [Rhodobacteraceae bacterium]|nr:ferrochelatase [Paracoccaceae bacterium]MCY4195915.1 ferrochelatase [Paracoccaceae bacterium]
MDCEVDGKWAELRNAPDDHPRVKIGKIGVLISNLGSPDNFTYWAMRRYLSEFLSDRRVIDYPRWMWQPILQLIVLSKRPFTSGAAYRSIWNHDTGESPLLHITRNQHQKLSKIMAKRYGGQVITGFGMRYGNPSTKSALHQMAEEGCRKILHFPLYPQYSATTTASANDAFFLALTKMKWQPAVGTVAPYYDNPDYIGALAESLQRHLQELDFTPDAVVASYHGLPKRYLIEGDPYHCQCQKTSRLLKERLGWDDEKLVTSFQSRFGSEEWLQPYTVDAVAALAREGRRRIAVMAPGFSADCIETLEEIQEEIKDAFIEAGGECFSYIPCLNSDDSHIAMMESVIAKNLSGWIDECPPESPRISR